MRKIGFCMCMFFVLSATGTLLPNIVLSQATYTTTQKPRIIIVDFEDTNTAAQDEQYGAAVAAMIGSSLAQNKNVLLVENREVTDKIRDEKADISSLTAELSKEADVMIHGSVSLIGRKEEKGKEKTIIVKEGTVIVDMRIASLQTGAALTSRHFEIENIEKLRSDIDEHVKKFIEEYLRPYSGLVNILVTGYESREIDAEPKTIYATFFSDRDGEEVTLEYRPMKKSEIGYESTRVDKGTLDKDYVLAGKSFFELDERLDEESDAPSVPLINGEYKFRLNVPGYKISEKNVMITPGETKSFIFDLEMDLSGLTLTLGSTNTSGSLGRDFRIVLNGLEKWNGKLKTKKGKDKKRLSLLWKPDSTDQPQKAEYIYHEESGYGYLPQVRVKKISYNKYLLDNLPIGKYLMYTIPEPHITHGHISIEAFIDKKNIEIKTEEKRQGEDNKYPIVGKKDKGKGGNALIYLDSIMNGRPEYTKAVFLMSTGNSGFVHVDTIERYGEILLSGLDKGKSYEIKIVNSKLYDDEKIIIPIDTEYPYFTKSELKPYKESRYRQPQPQTKPQTKRITKAADSNVAKPDVISPEEIPVDVARHIKMLKSHDAASKVRAAREICNSRSFHPELLEVVRSELINGYTKIGAYGYSADALSWLCNVLGASGKTKYQSTLNRIANETSNGKLRKYAKLNYRKLSQ